MPQTQLGLVLLLNHDPTPLDLMLACASVDIFNRTKRNMRALLFPGLKQKSSEFTMLY